MSSIYTEKLLRQFGHTDGLLSGGNLATGLIVYCIIATTEGFGREGIVLSTFLLFFLSAILEIPTGYLGDRVGWKFSVRLGLFCDFVSTLFFGLTIFFAIQGYYILMLSFLVMRQLFSALNGAFTSGSYQAAYQRWYQEKLEQSTIKISDAPPLFLASYKYGIWIRLGLPLIALGIGLLLQTEFFSQVSKEYVALVPLGMVLYVLLIQIVAYFKMAKDLDFSTISIKKGNSTSDITITKLFLSAQATFPILCTYAYSHIFLQVCNLFLVGESYYLFKEANLPMIFVWGGGMGAAVIITFFGIAISRFFIPWLSKQPKLRSIRWLGTLCLSLLSAVVALTFYSNISTVAKLVCIFSVILIAYPISFALRAEITSDSHRFVPDEFKASWFSGGSLLARLTYAMIAGLILIAGVPHMGIFVMMSVLGIIGTSLAFINYQKGENVSKFERASLKKCLGMIIGVMFFITSFLVFLGETWYFVKHATDAQRQQDQIIAEQYAGQFAHLEDISQATQLLDILSQKLNVDCVDINTNLIQQTHCNTNDSSYSVSKVIYYNPLLKQDQRGTITVYFNDSIIHQKILHHLIIVAAIYIAFVLLVLSITYRIVKRICSEAKMVLDVAMDKLSNNIKKANGEERYFIDEFATMANKFNDFIENEKRMANLKGINQIAAQVAHDIRSPLTALEMIAEQSIETIPERNRILFRSAVDSINDIANGLLVVEREQNADKDPAKQQISKQLLSTLLEEVVSEKRVQYRRQPSVEIQLQVDNDAYGLFVNIHANTLRRVLSNLINNSVEAKGNKPNINIQLRLQELNNRAAITIIDNGQGIPNKRINDVLKRGVSIGKPGSTGLGLSHAKTTVESWQGELAVCSEPGVGTQITIILPLQATPSWFLPLLVLPANSQVMILDDDISMHGIWQSRLASLPLTASRIEVNYFRNETQAIEFYQKKINPHRPLLFLSDYELIGRAKTGLDIIEALQIAQHSIIVTNHYKSSSVLERCAQLGIKVLPKPLTNWLSIEVSTLASVNYDAVHIEDNKGIRVCWELDAKIYPAKLLSLKSPVEFERYADQISKDTPIYIDNEFIGEEITGCEWAKTLYERGFKRLILTSGLIPINASEMYWFESIGDKRSPWAKARERDRLSIAVD
ncbi:ATP-binding protein [Endozoicomonas sp. SM1973]|uniref:histidine kinase n=1 Tax=Spartinivicinus marinus TaxID=2994442 RepID=A0A853IB07_9GAMM|nr:ATP-binding protein [Spartinivicinus marinus]MCX4027400.1 ATP-binding protein [Spartinivicinus marinus]NYZ66425.1 ATP-binding protein [Spartinivicinus marinus]